MHSITQALFYEVLNIKIHKTLDTK